MADRQESLFGRGEQLAQLNRLPIPSGLKSSSGVGVSPAVLKGVLRVVDDADRGGAGGLGCTLAIETIAQRACVSRPTAERALEVLTGVLGFLTHERRQKGRRPLVERRICWGAVRAFNAGEAIGGSDHRAVASDHRAGLSDHRAERSDHRARGAKRIQAQPSAKIQSARGGGLSILDQWKGRGIDAGELADASQLATLFAEAAAAGLVKDSDADRLALLAWASYCRREGRNPGALFVAGLGADDAYGRSWRAKPTQRDEEWARRVLRSVDRPPPDAASGAPAVLGSARECSPAERIRRLYADGDRTSLLRAARLRLGRDSDAYREFARGVGSSDDGIGGGVLDGVADDLLLRVFSRREQSDGDEAREAGGDSRGRTAGAAGVCDPARRDPLLVRRGASGLFRQRVPQVRPAAAEAEGEGLS